jgi:hypothetical protein
MQQEMLLGQSTISLGGTSEVIGSSQDHHKIKSSGSKWIISQIIGQSWNHKFWIQVDHF